jgi:hypothetical protein
VVDDAESDSETAVDSGEDERARFTALASALQAGSRRSVVQVQGRPGDLYLEVTLASQRAFSLAAILPDSQIPLVITGLRRAHEAAFSGLRHGAAVEIAFAETLNNNDLVSLAIDDCHGTVELTAVPRALSFTATESSSTVRLRQGAGLIIEDAYSPDVVIELHGGFLDVRAIVSRVDLCGSGRLRSPTSDGPQVVELLVREDSTLSLEPGGNEPPVGTVRSPSAHQPHTLTLESTDDSIKRRQFGAVTRVRLKGGYPKCRVMSHSMMNATLAAPMQVFLEDRATVTDAEFETAGEAWVAVNAGRDSLLLNCSGAIELGNVPYLHVGASDDVLKVREIDDGDGEFSPDSWKGIALAGVELPSGLTGRKFLTRLDQAFNVTPDTRQLPGRDQTVLARLFRTRRTTYSDGDTTLMADAEYVRELSKVCREKGAPGSVATMVGWCAYRLRALKAHGVERLALAVYRWLGYGERPVPALLLWVFLSLALAGPVLAIGGAGIELKHGVDNFFVEVGRIALGPLAGITKGGSLDSGKDVAELFARTIAAIPLLTGALALRNYVKSER